MQFELTTLLQNRQNTINISSTLTLDQVNQIPVGLNNNIAWHMGHMVVTPLLLCYVNSGLEVPEEFAHQVEKYRKGTRPEAPVTQEDLDQLQLQLVAAAERLGSDIAKDLFVNFKAYNSSFGIRLNSFKDAFRFSVMHDTLHLGYIMALRKSVVGA